MNHAHEYGQTIQKYTYAKDSIKKIFYIFEGRGGNQIISQDIIPRDYHIKDLIVANSEITQGLNYVHSQLLDIYTNDHQTSATLFYFSQYGGSKTQFLKLIESEIEAEMPNCIPIFLEDLDAINSKSIFDKMIAKVFQRIGNNPDFQETPKFQEFFQGMNQIITEIQVSLNQSKNLQKAEEIIKKLSNQKNPTTTQLLNELNDLLHSTVLVDDEEILTKIIRLMHYCSQNKLLFLFLFDEVDLWLNDRSDELRFSGRLMQKANFMKLLLEIPDHQIRTFMVFACTDRVNYLFQSMQGPFSTISPTASRMVRLYNAANKIVEPGCYGDSVDAALVKLAAYFTIAQNNFRIEPYFFTETAPLLIEKYKTFSRRVCNSKIIELLNNYLVLKGALESGLKNWENDTQRCGNILQEQLQPILKRMNIKFTRQDVLIDPEQKLTKDKLDGYFVNYSMDSHEHRILGEIKLTKKFKGEKAYQVLQYLQLHPTDQLIQLIFSPTPMLEIQQEINRYAESQNYPLDMLKRLHIIHIANPFAFAAIQGITQVISDPAKYEEFLNAFAVWLDFYGEFSKQYLQINNKLGFYAFSSPTTTPSPTATASPTQSPTPSASSNPAVSPLGANPLNPTQGSAASINPSTSNNPANPSGSIPPTSIGNPGGSGSANIPLDSPKPDAAALTNDQRTCVNLLNIMFSQKIFVGSKTGRMAKAKILKIIEEKALGITNLDPLLETMKKANIVINITPAQLTFNPELLKVLALKEFNDLVISMFTKGGSGNIDRFF